MAPSSLPKFPVRERGCPSPTGASLQQSKKHRGSAKHRRDDVLGADCFWQRFKPTQMKPQTILGQVFVLCPQAWLLCQGIPFPRSTLLLHIPICSVCGDNEWDIVVLLARCSSLGGAQPHGGGLGWFQQGGLALPNWNKTSRWTDNRSHWWERRKGDTGWDVPRTATGAVLPALTLIMLLKHQSMDITAPTKRLLCKRNHWSKIPREFQSLWHSHVAFRSIFSILGPVPREKPIAFFLVQPALMSSLQRWAREGDGLDGGESMFFPPSVRCIPGASHTRHAPAGVAMGWECEPPHCLALFWVRAQKADNGDWCAFSFRFRFPVSWAADKP